MDLGVISDQACIVSPSNCGPEGGTFMAFAKFIESENGTTIADYIISSMEEKVGSNFHEGISIRTYSNQIR